MIDEKGTEKMIQKIIANFDNRGVTTTIGKMSYLLCWQTLQKKVLSNQCMYECHGSL